MSSEDSKAKAPQKTATPPSSGRAPSNAPPVTPPSNFMAKRQPYGLQRDYRVLEREQRVTTILTSGAFKNELESILQGQITGTRRPSKPIQRPQEHADQIDVARLSAARGAPHVAAQAITPINDLRGLAGSKYTLVERQLRCKLAAFYRLADLLGWGQFFYNHVTARGNSNREHYLVSPFGLLCQEVTASSLVEVTLAGEVVDPGSTQLGVSRENLALHSVIHASREDVRCAVHLQTTAGVAVSSMSCGLLPLSQEALNVSDCTVSPLTSSRYATLGTVSYHNYTGAPGSEDEKDQIARDLGPINKVLILRNHGLVAMGSTIEEAFYHTFNLMRACEIQVAAISAGIANLLQMPDGCGRGITTQGGGGTSDSRVWRTGDLEFEAFMRMLDNKGYYTGYLYKAANLLEPAHTSKSGGHLVGEKGDSTVEPKQTARPTPGTQRKLPHDSPPKLESTPTRPVQVTSKTKDVWDFLDEKKRHRPITKRTHLKQQQRQVHADVAGVTVSADEDLWGFLDSRHEDHRPMARQQEHATTSPVLNSAAVGKSQSHSHIEDHESQSDLSPPPKECELKQVGHSTPTQKVKRDIEKGPAYKIHRPADINPPPNLTPLELAQYTAERVAQSTGEAVEKLAAQVQVHSPHEQKHTQVTSAAIPQSKSPHEASKSGELHDRKATDKHKPLQNGLVLVPSIEMTGTVPPTHPSSHHNSNYSNKEALQPVVEPGLTEVQAHPMESHSHTTQSSPAHGWPANPLHHPANIEYPEGYSPAEKMVYAAQVVAGSTSIAVQKLSSSLVEHYTLSSSGTDPL